MLPVIAKERELLAQGYREKKFSDVHLLGSGEYLVRVPGHEDIAALQGWEQLSIIWRTP